MVNYRCILWVVLALLSFMPLSAQYTGEWVVSHFERDAIYPSGTSQSTLLESADAAHFAVMGMRGSEFFLRLTSDSGKTWKTVMEEDENSEWIQWRAIAHPTPEVVYLLRDSSYRAFDTMQGVWRKFYRTHLYRSGDGGKTWERNAVGVSGSNRAYGQSYTFTMVDSLYGVVARYVFGEDKTVLLITEDGGKSWQERDVPEGLVIVWRVYCPERGVYIVHDWRGRVERSDDDGKSWQRLVLPKELGFIELSFVDSQRVWIAGGIGVVRGNNGDAVSERDAIYRSVDGGKTWQVSLDTMAAISAGLTGIAFADELNGIAVGRGGKIYRTRDGGATWQRENSPYVLLYTGYTEVAYPSVACAIALATGQFIVRYTGREILQRPESIRPFGSANSLYPVFEWRGVEGADSYRLQVAEQNRKTRWDITFFGENTVVDTVVSGLSWLPPLGIFRANDSIFYYYRVQARRGTEQSDGSAVRTFGVVDKDPLPLGTPIPVSPGYGATTVQPVQLSWRSVEGAEQYEVQVANTISFEEQDTAEIVARFTVNDTAVGIPSLKSGYWYFWHVRALAGNRSSLWSSRDGELGVFKTATVTDVGEVVIEPQTDILRVEIERDVERVRVSIEKATAGELRLYSSSGREIGGIRRRVERGSSAFELVLDALPSGMYYLVYRSNTGELMEVQAVPFVR